MRNKKRNGLPYKQFISEELSDPEIKKHYESAKSDYLKEAKVFKTTWNYRMHYNKKAKQFEIREVYYRDGVPWYMTATAVEPIGDTREELIADMNEMLRATEKPLFKGQLKEEGKE